MKESTNHVPGIRKLLTHQFVLVIVITTMVIAIVGTTLHAYSTIRLIDTQQQENVDISARMVNAEIDHLLFSSNLIATNRELCLALVDSYISAESKNETNQMELISQMRTYILNLSTLSPIYSVAVYYHNENKQYFYSLSKPELYHLSEVEDAVTKVRENPNEIVYITDFSPSNALRLCGIARSMRHPDTYDVFAELVVLTDVNKLLTNAATTKQNTFIYGHDGNRLSNGSNMQEIPDSVNLINTSQKGQLGLFHGRNRYYTADISRMSWTVISVNDHMVFLHDIVMEILVVPAVAFFSTILALFIVAVIARKIENDLGSVVQDMQRVANGEMIETNMNHRLLETNQLSFSLNQMVSRLRESMTLLFQREVKQKEAEFYALQAQINPHFFYNTLDTINTLLLVRNQYDLSDIVVDLADVFRFSVSKTDDVIPLTQEIELIKEYLHIMKFRYEDRLVTMIDCEPETLNCKVVKLLIQPLVENAIIHGVENSNSVCTVTITTHINHQRLIIQVADNGTGIDPDIAEAINAGTYQGNHDRHSGVGLKNISQRIHMYYGEEYLLTISPDQNSGTLVTMILPVIRELEHRGGIPE